MICKKCNAIVSEEGATYCHACGARLDGKKACPACGRFIEEAHTYCVYCGERTDGKVACPACGTYHAGAFCPDCGAALKESAAKETACERKEKKPADPKKKERIWTAVFSWIRSGAGIACAVFALIFVFLIGIGAPLGNEAKNLLTSAGMGGLLGEDSKSLYYFFGDVYKDLDSMKTAATFRSNIPIASGYVYAVLGTVISVATIASVVGFAVPAIVGFVQFATTRVENNSAKWGVRAAIAFLGGAAALYALDVISMDLVVQNPMVSTISLINIRTGVAYNGATVAGIVLCIIFLVVYAASNLVRKGRAWKKTETIVAGVLTAVGVVFAMVAYAVAKGGYVGFELRDDGTAMTVGGTFSQYYNNVILLTIAELTAGAQFYNEQLGQIGLSFVFSLLQQAAVLGVIVSAVGGVANDLFGTEKENKNGLVWSILLASFAVVQLVCGIVSQNAFCSVVMAYAESSSSTGDYTLLLGGGIVTVVFALLGLGVQIARASIGKRYE